MTRDILCMGGNIFTPSRTSLVHIMDILSERGNTVLWVNALPMRFPSVRKGSTAVVRRIVNKIRINMHPLSKRAKRFYVLCPLYVPIFGFRILERINDVLLILQVIFVTMLLRLRISVVWATKFDALPLVNRLRKSLFIYHLSDKYSAFRDLSHQTERRMQLEKKEAKLIEHADVILCSSHATCEHVLRRVSRPNKVRYFPHGVDFEHFSRAASGTLDIPAEMRKKKHPIIGYFGSLTDANDQETIAFCAQRRPEWSFVLIGKVMGDYSRLRRYPNVFLLGPKPYDVLPNYGQCFDVCLMNWRPHEWIRYSFPVKTLEYLAMGKPIVSAPIVEVESFYGDIIRIAHSPDEYLKMIEEELQFDSQEKIHKRIGRVRHATWHTRVDALSRTLPQYFQ